MKLNTVLKLVVSILICELAGMIGSIFTVKAIPNWYAGLEKSALNPPGYIFGPVWTTLYLLMGISLFLVWNNNWKVVRKLSPKRWKKAWNQYSQELWTGRWQKQNTIAIFSVQLFLNALWSIIFFGLKSPGFAFFWLIALWCAIVYTIINFYRISKPSAYLLIPYLLWVTFAGYLNLTVWMLNG